MITVDTIKDDVTNRMNAMLDKTNLAGFFKRVILPMYQDAQKKRWNTENESEGDKWERLNTDYARRKLRKFADYDYHGTKMLVATGDLLKNVMTGNNFAEKYSITIFCTTPYAKYVAEARPFMKFSDESKNKMKDALISYINGVNK